MPQVTVGLAESAVADLEELRQWYVDQKAQAAGDRTVAGIFERIDALRDHPDMGRIVPEFGQPFLRELIYPPVRIVYRRETRQVRIVRVWRSERLLRLPPV